MESTNQSYPYETARLVDSITIAQWETIYQALERTLSEKLARKYKREKTELATYEKADLKILKKDICQKMKQSGNTNCIVQAGDIIPITYVKQSHIADTDLGKWTEYKDATGVWEWYLKDGKWSGIVRHTDPNTKKSTYAYMNNRTV